MFKVVPRLFHSYWDFRLAIDRAIPVFNIGARNLSPSSLFREGGY
jgi:hypothetical protein